MSAEKLPPDGYELGPGWMVAGLRGGSGYVSDKGQVVGPDDAEAAGAIVRKAEAPTRAEAAGTIAATRAPRPPEELVGALQDRCHQESKAWRAARSTKAEAPTACGVCGDPEPHVLMVGECFTRTEEEKRRAFPVAPATPPEQPSGNPGELGSEAPTLGPVALHDAVARAVSRGPAEAPTAPVGQPAVGSITDEVLRIVHAFIRPGSRQDDVRILSARIAALGLEARLSEAGTRRDARIAALEAELAKARKSREEIAAIAVKQHAATVAGVQATKRVVELEAEVSHLKYTTATDLELMKTNAAVRERLGVELAARIVERDGWMEAAAKSEAEKTAAVQDERERAELELRQLLADEGPYRGIRWAGSIEIAIDRIKNGDPAT